MNSSNLLWHWEHCRRSGIFARDWERWKIDHTEMLARGIREGLTTQAKSFGEEAGSACMGLGAEPGLESKDNNLYDQVAHLACLADIVTSALRKHGDAPWESVKPVQIGDGPWWYSNAFLDPDGTHLRRVVLVSGWSDDRHYSTCRGWDVLGDVCVYGLPMQVAVIVLGNWKNGKRHGYWSHGLRHPVSKALRFRKKHDVGTPFKSSWLEIFREDYDEITTQNWLEAMLSDGVLKDVCFRVDLPLPEKTVRQKILDLASRNLEQVYKTKVLPPQQLSTCDWPTPCAFRTPCHREDEAIGRYGFVRLEHVG